MNLDWQSIYDVRYYILEGLINTCLLTVIGIVLSSILGILFSLLRISKNRVVRGILIAYIELWRNTPIVAQIFFLYFAMPLIGIKVSAFACGLIALVLHFNAYNIEVLGAILSAGVFSVQVWKPFRQDLRKRLRPWRLHISNA